MENKLKCDNCGSDKVISTYDTVECMECYYIKVTRLPPQEVLKEAEIRRILNDTLTQYNVKEPRIVKAVMDALATKDNTIMDVYGGIYEHNPVHITELLDSDNYFLPITRDLWPILREEIVLTFENPNIENIYLMGSLGYGKTYYLGICMMVIGYYLMCLRNPQKFLGLAEQTRISMFNFCTSDSNARKTLFNYLLNNYDAIPWFRKNAPRIQDKNIEIDIPSKKIVYMAGGANPSCVIGTNLHTFVGDEVNFMKVVQDSKKAKDGEKFDEAQHTTDVLTNRQKSRITNPLPYCPPRRFLASSEQFPEDYLPRRAKEAIANGRVASREEMITGDYDKSKKDTYIIHYANWETKPKKSFPAWTFKSKENGEVIYYGLDGKETNKKDGEPEFLTFQVGMNHPKKGDRILKPNESVFGYDKIVEIPIFYRKEFEGSNANLYKALRDIAGVATIYSDPWFTNSQIIRCINPNREHPCNYVNPTMNERDFMIDVGMMKQWGGGHNFINPNVPRYVHLDLSKNTDHAGVCISHVAKMTKVLRRVCGELVIEELPYFFVDLMLRIRPAGNGLRIDFSQIRNIIYMLRKKGMQFGLITYDKVEGEMATYFDKNDIPHDYLSLDTNIEPWFHISQTIAEERVDFYDYEPLKEELPFLYYDESRRKIDHRPNKRKDISDAFAGSIWNASLNKNFSTQDFGIEVIQPSELHEILRNDPFAYAEVGNFYGKDYKI